MGACFGGVLSAKYKTPKNGFKVCVCGGAGEIGQPLCMLLASNPLVWELSVYDLSIAMVPAERVSSDVNQLAVKCKATAYPLQAAQKPVDNLGECLQGCSLVLVAASVPGKDRTKMDLLRINGDISKSIVEACAQHCPDAIIGLMANPLSSIVPAMGKLYEAKGLDPKRIVGITSLDAIRANKLVHLETGVPVQTINVPVVGCFADADAATAVPLFSQDTAGINLPDARRVELTSKLRDASAAIRRAKTGKGEASLSMAYGAADFATAVLDGLSGKRRTTHAYVRNAHSCPPLTYFSSPVTFGRTGVYTTKNVSATSDFELEQLSQAVRILHEDIERGLAYAEGLELAPARPVSLLTSAAIKK